MLTELQSMRCFAHSNQLFRCSHLALLIVALAFSGEEEEEQEEGCSRQESCC